MTREELGALLRQLVDSGRLTAAEAAALIRRFDIGDIAEASLPVPLSQLPGKLTTQEQAIAMREVAVQLTPKQAAPFLAAATRPVITSTPPEVRRFLRERLRNHFRADHEQRVRSMTKALADGGGMWLSGTG